MFRYRDKILVKGKGLMETYFIQLTDEMRIEEKEWSQENHSKIHQFINYLIFLINKLVLFRFSFIRQKDIINDSKLIFFDE